MSPLPTGDRRDESGYMLLGAFFLVAILAITSAVVVREWSFVHRRAMEAELKFRGERIMRAILEFKYKQSQGGGSNVAIANYESMEKALTSQPNPILPGIPPDPMTARYDEQGELVEGTGKWGLVVPAGTTPTRATNRFGSGPRRGLGTPLSQPGQPPLGRGFQVIGCEDAGQRRLGSGGLGGSGAAIGAVQVLGVASCLDDPDLKPIGASPQDDEEAATYREWLFIPPGAGQIATTGGGTSPGGSTSQQPTWQSNWPSSMPAPPFPGGVNAPGPGNQPQIPGGRGPTSPFSGRSGSGGRRGSSFGSNRP